MFLALALNVSGQEQRNILDFEYIRSTSPWLNSHNPAGFGSLPVDRIADVNGTLQKQDGGLIAIEESDDSFEAGASTESFIKISDKFTLHGKLEYKTFKGKNMGGPLLINPSYNPINFYESVDTTTGVKNKEMYTLNGGFSYAFNDRWSLGVEVDYISGDMSKRKDPRTLNVWMDLNTNAGVKFSVSESFSAGASFIYRRTLESIYSKTYGTTDKTYYTFIDYGGFYGSRELLDGTYAYVTLSETRPMFNSFIGGSIQVEAGKRTKFFNEVTFMKRSGYFGKRSSSSITYTEHSSNIIEYSGSMMTGRGDNLHKISLDINYEGLTNMKNNYKMVTPEGGSTIIEYFGQNNILSQTELKGALTYSGYLGVEYFRPAWEYGISAGGNMRSSVTTIYPWERRCSVTQINARAYGVRNMDFKENSMLTLGIEGIFATGFGNPKTDSALASSSSDAPRSMDIYLNRDFEYKTAMHAGGCVVLRYTRFLPGNLAIYLEVKDRFTHLLNKPEFLYGNFRNILETKIGLTF